MSVRSYHSFCLIIECSIYASIAGILDDAFALSMACKQTLSSLLSLLASFSEEDEYTLLSQIITVCSSIYFWMIFSSTFLII